MKERICLVTGVGEGTGAAIVPWTRDRFSSDTPDEFFITPRSIASEVFHIAHHAVLQNLPFYPWGTNVFASCFAVASFTLTTWRGPALSTPQAATGELPAKDFKLRAAL